MESNKKPQFSVHPSVVYQLGESLISDSVQALIELVKNSYDADASYAKVTIDTTGETDLPSSFFSGEGGRILVEDDGFGMSRQELVDSWLLISNRRKLELKKAKKTTPGGRTPLGDKGLGRLGVQRLGDKLEIVSKPHDKTAHNLAFSWLDFETAPDLQSVQISLEESTLIRDKGTTIIVSDLKEVATWKGQKAINRLEQELSQMISPYKEIRQFNVMVIIDGKPLNLISISDEVRSLAPMKYHISFDGETFMVKGKARLDFFKPERPEEADRFALLVESDNGGAFFEFLQKQKRAASIQLSQPDDWFAEFKWERKFESLDKVAFEHNNKRKLANPGPFWGEIDAYNLGQSAFSGQSVFDRISEYRNYIKNISGVKVYRDGFGVRVDQDWLGLGAMTTSGTSYYGLRPVNTLGYIALTAKDNMELEETTDREGFRDTPSYRNFYALMEEFKKFSTDVHTFFGRAWVSYKEKKNEELANVESRKSITSVTNEIRKGLEEADFYKDKIVNLSNELNISQERSKKIVARLPEGEFSSDFKDEIVNAFKDLSGLLEYTNEMFPKLAAFLEKLERLKALGHVLEDKAEGLSRQMDYMYETVALGITAEALSHEIFNVADHLAERARQIKNKDVKDRSVLVFIEYVNSAVITLRKQISYLSPSLRYVRERKEPIAVADFVDNLKDVYSDRLANSNVEIQVSARGKERFSIKMNKGKLSQIIDNLLLNSEYWLKEDLRQKNISKGHLFIEIDRPFIRISDNGRGIDPAIEPALFEPFNSAKKDGRGLGLFIVKQLLDSEGCNIGVTPKRNEHGRLYEFQIDLRGAIND